MTPSLVLWLAIESHEIRRSQNKQNQHQIKVLSAFYITTLRVKLTTLIAGAAMKHEASTDCVAYLDELTLM